ncbi:MAG TPA: nucleotidyltransferase [Kofleriaceae bacterium]
MQTPAADDDIEQALGALGAALGRVGAPWMVIGGIAVIAHGVRRMTTDIDAVVGGATSIGAILRELEHERIVARIADAEAFARTSYVLLVRHEPTGVELDIAVAATAFEQEALDARVDTRFGGTAVPMARPEDLVLYKAFAGRPKDVEDATALLSLYRDIDIERVRKRLAELAESADRPELNASLEDMLRIAKRMRPKS